MLNTVILEGIAEDVKYINGELVKIRLICESRLPIVLHITQPELLSSLKRMAPIILKHIRVVGKLVPTDHGAIVDVKSLEIRED